MYTSEADRVTSRVTTRVTTRVDTRLERFWRKRVFCFLEYKSRLDSKTRVYTRVFYSSNGKKFNSKLDSIEFWKDESTR
uniref:Ovule protein n=1 Tax=Steinernema glaseri TaxID=37863 RepID=A0A1I8A5P4_9BILA